MITFIFNPNLQDIDELGDDLNVKTLNNKYWINISKCYDWPDLETWIEKKYNKGSPEWWQNKYGEKCEYEDCFDENGDFDDDYFGPLKTSEYNGIIDIMDKIKETQIYKLIGTEKDAMVYNLKAGITDGLRFFKFSGIVTDIQVRRCKNENDIYKKVADFYLKDFTL